MRANAVSATRRLRQTPLRGKYNPETFPETFPIPKPHPEIPETALQLHPETYLQGAIAAILQRH